VIRRYTNVRRSLLDHLQNGIEDTDHRTEGPILAVVEATKPVEVPEQFVGAVDKMNNQIVARSRVITWEKSGVWHNDTILPNPKQ